jgi:hypothetical protein
MSEPDGLVVMSVRTKRERIVLEFNGATAVIELSNMHPSRCKAVVRAPVGVRIYRRRNDDAAAAAAAAERD